MKKICSILLTIILIISVISAASAAAYTLPEKMERQLQVGSGLKGSFVVHTNADSGLNPLVHSFRNAEFEVRGIQSEGNKHYYIYQQGENEAMNALTEYCTAGEKQYLRSDFLEGAGYLLPDPDHLINKWLKSEGENPSVFPDLLRTVLNGNEEENPGTESLERQIETWISSFSTDSSLQTGDGLPRLTQTFRIPVSEMYNTITDIIRTISSSETYMGYFREILSKEQIDTYLNPDLGYFYIDAMNQLDMDGEILFSRTVSTLGELIQSSLVLPTDPGRTGYSSVTLENNETRKSVFLSGPRGMLYLELPIDFDLKAENYEKENIRFVLVDNENEEAKNVALRIVLSKKSEKYENSEEGRIHENENYSIQISRDTEGLPEAVTDDLIPDMASAEAEINIHYSSKPQLSSPTTLEFSCRIKHGEFDFDLEGSVKTASPWVFAPFSVDDAINAEDYEKEDFDQLRETWIRNAEEKLIRLPEEIRQTDTDITEATEKPEEAFEDPESENTPEESGQESNAEPAESVEPDENAEENEPRG